MNHSFNEKIVDNHEIEVQKNISSIVKTKPIKSIVDIQTNRKDINGHEVVNILAAHNESIIYEINDKNIQNRIKVFIDGYDDEREEIIIKRFNRVKEKYIEAKGILLHTTNFETNKHRIAHTLSTCLMDDMVDGNELFNNLIKQIQKEHNQTLSNRFFYLTPSIVSVVVFFVISTIIFSRVDNKVTMINDCLFWVISYCLLSSSLGGAVSIMINSKNLNFQEFSKWYYYIILGCERLFFSIFTGAISFIIIKSKLIESSIITDSFWSFMMILVIAGFSESLIPSILAKSESTISNS